MKDFELLPKIPTERFMINGIVYNRTDVHEARFTKVISDSVVFGKLHVSWKQPQRAFVNEYGSSVNAKHDVKARECLCSGFLFNEEDLTYIQD